MAKDAVVNCSGQNSLQKKLTDITGHSKACESERDSLREERNMWVKTEADLSDSVKRLEVACSQIEQSRMELDTRLQGLKARTMQYLLL